MKHLTRFLSIRRHIGTMAHHQPHSIAPKPIQITIKPTLSIDDEIKSLFPIVQRLIGAHDKPFLRDVASYYSKARGKFIRPRIILLMSQAVNSRKSNSDNRTISSSYSDRSNQILPTQKTLAAAIEMLHMASLLHDDVIDQSTSRRNLDSANVKFGNKKTTLAGTYLLGRSYLALSRLGDGECFEAIADAVSSLVEGEILQLGNVKPDTDTLWSDDIISHYLEKTFLKTGSLIAQACRATALLGLGSDEAIAAAYSYGRNLGIAFQLADDLLDYTCTSDELGKPAGADLKLGLATAPLLFAWKQNPELGALVQRRFQQSGDIDKAREIVFRSSAIHETRALALSYADKAIEALRGLSASPAQQELMLLTRKAVNRKK